RVVQGENVGMRQLRRDRDLAQESLRADRLREVRVQQLECDRTIVLAVAGQIDRGCPTASEGSLDVVALRKQAGHERIVGHPAPPATDRARYASAPALRYAPAHIAGMADPATGEGGGPVQHTPRHLGNSLDECGAM